MMDCIALSLDSRAIPFHKNENRIRCIVHIINLSVQAALKCLKAEAEDEELNIASDDYDLDSAETVKKVLLFFFSNYRLVANQFISCASSLLQSGLLHNGVKVLPSVCAILRLTICNLSLMTSHAEIRHMIC